MKNKSKVWRILIRQELGGGVGRMLEPVVKKELLFVHT